MQFLALKLEREGILDLCSEPIEKGQRIWWDRRPLEEVWSGRIDHNTVRFVALLLRSDRATARAAPKAQERRCRPRRGRPLRLMPGSFADTTYLSSRCSISIVGIHALGKPDEADLPPRERSIILFISP
jgi:hypothetical protein